MVATVTFTYDQAGMDRLLRDPSSVMTRTFLPRIGNLVVNAAKPRANVDTGLMRSRIEFVLDYSTRPPTGKVIARTGYSYWVHNGNGRYRGNPFLINAAREVLGT